MDAFGKGEFARIYQYVCTIVTSYIFPVWYILVCACVYVYVNGMGFVP